MVKLKGIKVKNYKCFKEEQEYLELAPFTLVFGNNSSGKSALLKLFKLIGTPFLERIDLVERNVQGFNNSLEPTIIDWTFTDQFETDQEIEFRWISYPDEKELVENERDEVSIQFRRKNQDFGITRGVFVPRKLPAVAFSTLEFEEEELKEAVKKVFASIPDYLHPSSLKKTEREKVFEWIKNMLKTCMVEHSENEIYFNERKFADKIKQNYINFSLNQTNANANLDLLMPYFIDQCIYHEISPFIRFINNVIQNYNQQINYLPAFRYRPIKHYNGEEFRKLFGEDFMTHILPEDIGDEDNGNIVQIESFDLFEHLREQKMIGSLARGEASEEQDEEAIEYKEVSTTGVDEVGITTSDDPDNGLDSDGKNASDVDKGEERNPDQNQDVNSQIDFQPEEDGEITSQQLYEFTRNRKDAISILFNLMYELGYPNYDIEFIRILLDNNEMFKIFIKQGLESNIKRELNDVGFGISQIIPVLIGIAWNKGLLVVEEPEQHLHPRAQLNFSRAIFHLYLDNIRKGNYIFETHSQILVESFLKEINEGKFKSEDVSIFYIDQKDGESSIQRIRIYEDGSMDSWPHGYFTEIDEILGLL